MKIIGGEGPFQHKYAVSRFGEGTLDDKGFGMHKSEPTL
jgi:hypothetical protein